MATKSKGKQTVSALATLLIAGTNKRLASTTQVLIAGSSFTPAQVIEKLQAIVNLRSDVDAAKASTKAKLATEKADMPALRAFIATTTFSTSRTQLCSPGHRSPADCSTASGEATKT